MTTPTAAKQGARALLRLHHLVAEYETDLARAGLGHALHGPRLGEVTVPGLDQDTQAMVGRAAALVAAHRFWGRGPVIVIGHSVDAPDQIPAPGLADMDPPLLVWADPPPVQFQGIGDLRLLAVHTTGENHQEIGPLTDGPWERIGVHAVAAAEHDHLVLHAVVPTHRVCTVEQAVRVSLGSLTDPEIDRTVQAEILTWLLGAATGALTRVHEHGPGQALRLPGSGVEAFTLPDLPTR